MQGNMNLKVFMESIIYMNEQKVTCKVGHTHDDNHSEDSDSLSSLDMQRDKEIEKQGVDNKKYIISDIHVKLNNLLAKNTSEYMFKDINFCQDELQQLNREMN